MKLTQTLSLAALLVSSAAAIGPLCASDCFGSWNGTDCSSSNGWDCLCSSENDLDSINSCVSSSCSNSTDSEAVFAVIAQLCANAGATVTASAEATYSATSGGSLWPTGFPTVAAGPWFSAVSTCLPGAPSGYSGSGPWGQAGQGWNGRGPWGGSGWGCAWSTWAGPSHGPWGDKTGTWTACSSTTTSGSTTTSAATGAFTTVTETASGTASVVTGTTFGVAVVAASGTASGTASGSATATKSSTGGAASFTGMGACGAMVVAIVGTIFAL